MILPQFIAVLIANLAIWQLPGWLSFMMSMVCIAIIVPMVVPKKWKL